MERRDWEGVTGEEAARGPRAAPAVSDGVVPESQWRALLEALPGYVTVSDRERRIRAMNRATPGREVQRFLGRDFADFVAPEQRQLIDDATRRILAGAGPVEFETQGMGSGHWYVARIAGIRERGETTGFVTHVLDVDDTKQAELERDQLRARLAHAGPPRGGGTRAEDVQRRLELMADHLPILVSYVDRKRRSL